MTLNATASLIQIKNSLGQVKFTSDNRLVYQKAFLSGSLSLTSGGTDVPFQALTSNDFLIITIKIYSGTGNADLIAGLSNKDLPANGSIIVDFYARNESNKACADTEWISISLVGTQLKFKKTRATYTDAITDGTTTVGITYKARIWSYL